MFEIMKPWFVACGLVLLLFNSAVVAESEEEKEEPTLSTPPIVVFNVASVDRVMEDIDYLFGSVDREDLIEAVDGLLDDIGNLQGLPRDKPLGVLLFLEPGLVPKPTAVVYVPVDVPENLIQTLKFMGISTEHVADDRYELSSNNDQDWHVRLIDGYAFAAREKLTLDRELPDPAEAFATLSQQYDVALDVRPESIPAGMRQLLLTFVKNRAQAELQQREDESELMHALREAQGMSNLQLVERLLTQTRSVTLGLDVSREKQQAVFELVIEASPDSAFLDALGMLAEQPSRFTSLQTDAAAISASVNARIDEQTAKVQADLLQATETALGRALTQMDRGNPPVEEEDAGNSVDEENAADEIDPKAEALAEQLFAPFHRLLESRNLDGFTRFRAIEDGHHVLIGALEIPGAEELETPVREMIDRVLASRPGAAAAIQVEYGAAKAGEIRLHRVRPTTLDPEQRRVYGDDFAIYFGFGADAAWIGMGGGQTVRILDEAVTQIANANLGAENENAMPFSMTVYANRLLRLGDTERAAVPQQAFSSENDTMRINYRPTETGGRLRMELEEGFIRLLGLGISERFDSAK